MAFLVSSLMTLVVIFSSPISSMICDLSQSLDLGKQETSTALNQMQRISSFLCQKDRKDFRFPRKMVDGSQVQKAQAISVLHEMLQQTFDVFGTKQSSAAWNTTLLHGLLSGLHRQLEDLGTCLVPEMKEVESVLGTEDPTLAMKRYFQGIHLYLEEKQYSDCAWEVVRVEIRRYLFVVNKFTRKEI
ncbi:Interferon omega-2 [Pteropus alecto]|uniref:Interferon omega-2 n=2 Tax=Pteropus alecto TaxID=9402 RepID=L5K635_PTEAL|nr:Interferon omega-2 [Pteropus alecto]